MAPDGGALTGYEDPAYVTTKATGTKPVRADRRTPRNRRRFHVRKFFGRSIGLLLVVAAVAALAAAGAGASAGKKAAGGDVCVLMPDTATSIRWVHYDVPALKSEFKKAGVTAQFYNADGDAQKQ